MYYIPHLKYKRPQFEEIHSHDGIGYNSIGKVYGGFFDMYLTRQHRKIISNYDAFVTFTYEDALNWKGAINLKVIPNFIPYKSNDPALLDHKDDSGKKIKLSDGI